MTNRTRTPRHLHARDVKTQLRGAANVTMAGKLESNSSGQYFWLEAHTGAPITATLADLLAAGACP